MANICVRKTGNDTTGDGSTGAPYLTVAKAESVAVAGDTVIIGDGTYVEDNGSGRLKFDQNYASPVVFCSESGDPTKVRISASTQRVSITGSNMIFVALGFVGVSGHGWVVRLEGATVANVRFLECEFLVISSSGAITQALGSDFATSGGTHPGIEVIACTIRQQGYYRAIGIYFDMAATGGTTDGMVIRSNRVRVAGYCVRLGQGITNVEVVGNDLVSFNPSGVTDHCLLLGVDGQTGALSSGRITDNRGWNAHGHTIIVGAGVDGADVIGNTIGGGVNPADALDLGLVVKQASNVSVRRNFIDARNAAALYFKASANCQAFDNEITVARHANGLGIRTDIDSVDGGTCNDLTIRRNRVRASIGSALDLGAGEVDTGGSVVDENVYEISGSATLGKVYGTNVTTLTGMRAAWSSYDNPNNDRNSRVGARNVPFGGAPLTTLPTP